MLNGCISLVLMMPVLLQAQTKSYIGPSPNAASLGMYGQIPVSEYNGVPNISIPLYSIETEGFSMPVNLTYHGGALKNADDASWVGFGWSLNAGGVITRCKRDKNDFGANGFFRTTSDRACNDNVDQEPDMFFYNIGGRSGKFMILGPSATPTIRLFTRDNIKLTYNQGTETWTLVTGEGIIYTFGKYEFMNETTTGDGAGSESYTSSWYVSNIQLTNGTRIVFSYLANNTKITRTAQYGTRDYPQNFWPIEAASTCCPSGLPLVMSSGSSSTVTTNVDEVILSKIEFPNGIIKLNTGTRTDLKVKEGTAAAKKLDNIQVFSVQNGTEYLLKTISLTYDYYYCRSNQIPPVPGSRLRLLRVTESTPAAVSKPYTFQYGNDTLPAMNPGFTSFLGATGLLKSIVYPTGGSTLFQWETVQINDGTFPQVCGARIKKIYDRNGADSIHVRRYEYTGAKLFGKIRNGYSTTYTVNQVLYNCCQWEQVNFSSLRNRLYFSDFSSLSETANGNIFGHDKVITWFGENGENGKKESIFENTAPTDPNYYQGQIPVPVPLNTSGKNGLLKEEWEYRNDNGVFKPVRRVVNSFTSADVVVVAARRRAFDKCTWSYNVTTEWVQQSTQGVYTYDMAGTSYVYVNTNYYYDDPGNALPVRIASTDSKNRSMLITNYYAKQKSTQSGGIYTTMLNRNMISPVIEQEKSRNGVIVSRTSTTYKDWFNNGRLIRPETVLQSKAAQPGEVTTRYHAYDENGNVLALSTEKGKTVSYIWGYGNSYPVAEVTNVDHEPVYSYQSKSHNTGGFLDLASTSPVNFQPFTTNHGQTYNFSIRFMPVMTNGGTFSGSVQLMLRNSAGNILYQNFYYQDNTYTGSVNLPNGTDTYYWSAQIISPGLNTYLIRVDVTSAYQVKNTTYNFFHTSFEDLTSGFIAGGKTGNKCIQGPYSVNIDRKPGNYIISWWQQPLTGGNWVYQEQLVAAANSSFVIGSAGLLIDEVRLYPQDAFMTTYTYLPLVGMTTKCDERAQVTYYEYDELNRLKVIRDHNNNIVKIIEYNYRNN